MMDSIKYYKKYILLEALNTDILFNNNGEGYLRIENIEDKCRIYCRIKNIFSENVTYKLFLIRYFNNNLETVFVGELTKNNDVYKIEINTNGNNVMGSNIDITEFGLGIVTGSENKSIHKNYICFLGKIKRNQLWNDNLKNKVKDEINNRHTSNKEPIIEEKKDKAPNKENLLIDKLKKNFKKIDPFNNKRLDYEWFEVENLAVLSNILYQCDIKIPLFANPKILISIFKYKHMLAGIYTNSTSKQYFVLGIASEQNEEEKPFDDICKWVSKNSSYSSNRQFGYWLVFIDPETEEFMK